jgi:multidrug transporter EmrE-like cation transporter
MHPLLLAVASVMLSVGAQFALKAGVRASAGGAVWAALLQPMVLFGLCLYALSAVVWLAVLARWDVSKAYPLVGMGFAMSAVVGYWLGEPMNAARWAGVALICAGVYVVSRS